MQVAVVALDHELSLSDDDVLPHVDDIRNVSESYQARQYTLGKMAAQMKAFEMALSASRRATTTYSSWTISHSPCHLVGSKAWKEVGAIAHLPGSYQSWFTKRVTMHRGSGVGTGFLSSSRVVGLTIC